MRVGLTAAAANPLHKRTPPAPLEDSATITPANAKPLPRFLYQSVAKVTLDPSLGQAGPFDPSAVVKVDVWSPGPRCIINEPMFVPRQGAWAGGWGGGYWVGRAGRAVAFSSPPLPLLTPTLNFFLLRPPPPCTHSPTPPAHPHTRQNNRQPPGATSEDDGYVIVAVHDASTGKGDLAILDAGRLSAGPLATIHLPHLLPAGLHGSFSREVFHESSPAEPKWAEPVPVKQI